MTNPPPPQRPSTPYDQTLNETRAARKALEAQIAAARRRRRVGAIAAVVAIVAVLVGGVTWFVRRDTSPASTPVASPSGKTCETLTPVTLWAAPSMQRWPRLVVAAPQRVPERFPLDRQSLLMACQIRHICKEGGRCDTASG